MVVVVSEHDRDFIEDGGDGGSYEELVGYASEVVVNVSEHDRDCIGETDGWRKL